MEVFINGEPSQVPDGCTISGLLGWLKLESERVAIELDGEIARRDRWAETVLAPGDRLEIVHFVGGG